MDFIQRYSCHVAWSPEDECFVATTPEFPHVSAFGDSWQEALDDLHGVLQDVTEAYREDGRPLPQPLPKEPPDLPSGKFQVRIPRLLHKRLADAAKRDGVSQNSMLISLIADGLGRRDALVRSQAHAQEATLTIYRVSRQEGTTPQPQTGPVKRRSLTHNADVGDAGNVILHPKAS